MEEQKEKLKQKAHIPLILWDLWRNAWLILLAGIIAVMGVFCYAGLLHSPEYTTTVVFAVSPRSNGSYVGFYNSLRTASEMAEVFEEVFTSDVLKRLVKEDLGNPSMTIRVSAELGIQVLLEQILRIFLCNLLNKGRYHTAGVAPVGIEVKQNSLFAAQDFIKIVFVYA